MGCGMVGVAQGKSLIKQIIRSQGLTKLSGERGYTGKIVYTHTHTHTYMNIHIRTNTHTCTCNDSFGCQHTVTPGLFSAN